MVSEPITYHSSDFYHSAWKEQPSAFRSGCSPNWSSAKLADCLSPDADDSATRALLLVRDRWLGFLDYNTWAVDRLADRLYRLASTGKARSTHLDTSREDNRTSSALEVCAGQRVIGNLRTTPARQSDRQCLRFPWQYPLGPFRGHSAVPAE